jgi:hypothetical protein
MTFARTIQAVVLTLLFSGVAIGADDEARPVPAEKIRKLGELTKVPEGNVSAEKLLEVYKRQLYDAMRLAARLEREYPTAPNLYKVQRLMMAIADAAWPRPDPRTPWPGVWPDRRWPRSRPATKAT